MTSFSEARAGVSRLLDGHICLAKAHIAALLLVTNFPSVPEAYFMLNLVETLSNRGEGVIIGPPKRIAAARTCPGFTNQIHGDMLRDQLGGIARFGQLGDVKNALAIGVEPVRALHKGDDNRLACLIGFHGRLHAAEGNHDEAIDLFSVADDTWRRLGKDANPAWVTSNLVEWLRSEVRRHGPRSQQALGLRKRIPSNGSMAHRRAQILMKPGGLRLEHMLLTHR